MADQKKLRDMMRKEKEQRSAVRAARPPARPATTTARPATTAAPRPAAVVEMPVRKSDSGNVVPVRKSDIGDGVPARKTGSDDGARAPPEQSGAGGLLGAYGDDSDEEVEEPPEKRQRRTSDAAAMPPPPAPRKPTASVTDAAVADSLAMPPPASKPAARSVAAAPAPAPAPSSVNEPAKVDARVALAVQRVDALGEPSEAGMPGDDAALEASGVAAESEASTLPEGFFDDPEADALARGVEAPSVKAQRELEEGLKKFEKEMAVEQEKAEETRNDIDEARYEEVAQEEEEFQTDLHRRIEALRKRRQERPLEEKPAAVKADTVEAEGGEADGEAADEDSGSDVDFDWRAKSFG